MTKQTATGKKQANMPGEDLNQWFGDTNNLLTIMNKPKSHSRFATTVKQVSTSKSKQERHWGHQVKKAQPYCVVIGTKEHVTISPYFNAASQSISPYTVEPVLRGHHLLCVKVPKITSFDYCK